MNPLLVALSLMKEALTLLDEPETALIALHLRLALDAAERIDDKTTLPPVEAGADNEGDSLLQ